jgi:hypothetical protein
MSWVPVPVPEAVRPASGDAGLTGARAQAGNARAGAGGCDAAAGTTKCDSPRCQLKSGQMQPGQRPMNQTASNFK